MKTQRFGGIFALLLSLCLPAFAQNSELFAIEAFPLELTTNKTVNLIFPFGIKSVDRGSQDIIVQKAKGIDNILQVKAAVKGFPQTNLTVITSDGKLYSFVADYTDEPVQLNIELVTSTAGVQAIIPDQHNEYWLKQNASQAGRSRGNVKRISDRNFKVSASLEGVYVKDDVLFYRILLRNRSHLSYQIEKLRFVIEDKKQVRRAAMQQRELEPLYVLNETPQITGQGSHRLVVALPKFTIPDQKQLTIRFYENQGGRNLRLKVPNKTIVRAWPLK